MLRITLAINDQQIADYEVRNLGQMGGDARHTYSVSPIIDGVRTGEPFLQITHLRELGAEFLAAQVLFGLSSIHEIEGQP